MDVDKIVICKPFKGHEECTVCKTNETLGYRRYRHTTGPCSWDINQRRCNKCNLTGIGPDGKYICSLLFFGSYEDTEPDPNFVARFPYPTTYIWGVLKEAIVPRNRKVRFKYSDGTEQIVVRKKGQRIYVEGKYKICVYEKGKKFLTKSGWGY